MLWFFFSISWLLNTQQINNWFIKKIIFKIIQKWFLVLAALIEFLFQDLWNNVMLFRSEIWNHGKPFFFMAASYEKNCLENIYPDKGCIQVSNVLFLNLINFWVSYMKELLFISIFSDIYVSGFVWTWRYCLHKPNGRDIIDPVFSSSLFCLYSWRAPCNKSTSRSTMTPKSKSSCDYFLLPSVSPQTLTRSRCNVATHFSSGTSQSELGMVGERKNVLTAVFFLFHQVL